MIRKTTQSDIIRQVIDSCLDKGIANKDEIIKKVVEELGVPRPTVRRIVKDLAKEYHNKSLILSGANLKWLEQTESQTCN